MISPIWRPLAAASVLLATPLLRAQAPSAEFARPPDSARPEVFWHWMNGNVTAQGITLDLEAMRRVGITGVQIYNAAPSIPPGPAGLMTPEWRRLSRFALQEADRLGMTVGFHNCAGWSSSGGPWVPVEDSMMELTWSETPVAGGAPIDRILAAPARRKGFYREVACIAIPAAAGQSQTEAGVTAATSLPGANAAALVDGDPLTLVTGPAPSRDHPETVTLRFPQPFQAQTLEITPGTSFGAHGGHLDVSDDGVSWRPICRFQIPEMGNAQSYLSQGFAVTRARQYRLTFDHADLRRTPLTLAEVTLSPDFRLANWRAKAGFIRQTSPGLDHRAAPPGMASEAASTIDLTDRLDASGRLRWTPPPGRWTVLRFGYTTKDKFNKPAGPGGAGYECDKMSRAALDVFWSGMMRTLLTDNADLVGRSFRYVLLDSFEVGTQNFTAALPAEFERRCGYSLRPCLPALTGRVIGSVDRTERFLWDYRRVVADLWQENYFDHLNELANRDHLIFVGQPYGNGNFDALSCGIGMDEASTEFWVGKPRDTLRHTIISSDAHLAGSTRVWAESFTAHPEDGAWVNYPGSLKALGDLAIADGVNAMIFHTYAHQPWTQANPGMTMGPYGVHFGRGNTWWDQMGPWMDHIARCQFLARQGHPVGDVLLFSGENSPVYDAPLLDCPEYRVDFIDRQRLQELRVVAGRLVTPSGMSYALLVLPREPRGYSLPVLRTLDRLVAAGARLMGSQVTRTPSLQGYPGSETEAAALAARIWSPAHAPQLFGGTSAAAALAHFQVAPDCSSDGGPPQSRTFAYLHRHADGFESYFITNQTHAPLQRTFTFRVANLVPELWDPLDGSIRRPEAFAERDGATAVRLALPAAGAMFVIFRRQAAPAPIDETAAWQAAPRHDLPTTTPWAIRFRDDQGQTRSLVRRVLRSWSEETDPLVRYFSGTARYTVHFRATDADAAQAQAGRLKLALGRVEVIARVALNGQPLGIVWTDPFTCACGPALRAGDNELEVDVANLWPNRLIGDQNQGDSRHWAAGGAPLQWPKVLDADRQPEFSAGLHWVTWRHYHAGAPLLPSGLLGPVQLLALPEPRPDRRPSSANRFNAGSPTRQTHGPRPSETPAEPHYRRWS